MSDLKDIVLLWIGRHVLKVGRYLVQKGGGNVVPFRSEPKKHRAPSRTRH